VNFGISALRVSGIRGSSVWDREFRTLGTQEPEITRVIGSKGRLLAIDSIEVLFIIQGFEVIEQQLSKGFSSYESRKA
jgi:hypothetical protein